MRQVMGSIIGNKIVTIELMSEGMSEKSLEAINRVKLVLEEHSARNREGRRRRPAP